MYIHTHIHTYVHLSDLGKLYVKWSKTLACLDLTFFTLRTKIRNLVYCNGPFTLSFKPKCIWIDPMLEFCILVQFSNLWLELHDYIQVRFCLIFEHIWKRFYFFFLYFYFIQCFLLNPLTSKCITLHGDICTGLFIILYVSWVFVRHLSYFCSFDFWRFQLICSNVNLYQLLLPFWN